MSHFQPNDKVVCIDATPIPGYLPPGISATISDFDIPGGMIKEGAIYCVLAAHSHASDYAVYLVGKPIFCFGKEVSWSGYRFRKIDHNSTQQKKRLQQKKPQEINR